MLQTGTLREPVVIDGSTPGRPAILAFLECGPSSAGPGLGYGWPAGIDQSLAPTRDQVPATGSVWESCSRPENDGGFTLFIHQLPPASW
ncbi:hypothetical protein ElyMa_006343300 [Elysia marginata]|uniref:Uncharacterized protein n=1 Tax=Elysia marginata TaxID=1093978 RepID=A0AAV4HNL8_9GAST|nr:hypothetical protein ElyMa_006343300 [Elysia marginata]